MPIIKMLVGLPASGKSTYSNKYINDNTYKIHSSDRLREELFEDENIQCDNNKLFAELHNRIKNDLRSGYNVVYDATNINRKLRMSFLQGLNKIYCYKEAIVFTTPYEQCLINNQNRDRKVHKEVIKRMYLNWNTPILQEGFDEIRLVKFIDIANTNILDKMIGFRQDNPHHKLDLFHHCLESTRYIIKKTDEELLITATLLHDCGKIFTKSFTNSKGEVTSIAHYYNHNNCGAYDVLNYNLSDDDGIIYISALIEYHMKPYLAWNQSEKAKEKDRKLLGNNMFNDIMLLHEADVCAH